MMSFWPKNGRVQIKTGEFEILSVTHFKFLGVFIDENLTWNYHTEYLHNKLISNKHLLSTSQNILDTNCLMKIYYGHIHSHLIYKMKVWGSMRQPVLD